MGKGGEGLQRSQFDSMIFRKVASFDWKVDIAKQEHETMIDRLFVAAVLEGFEGTLGEVMDRVEDEELKIRIEVLESRAIAFRVSIEKPDEAHDPHELDD